VLLASGGTLQLASDSATVDACIAQCRLEQLEEMERLWGVLQNELDACDSLGFFDDETWDHILDCAGIGTLGGGAGGVVVGGCITGTVGGAAGGVIGCIGGPPGSFLGFCAGFVTACVPGALVGGGVGAGVGGFAGACVGYFRADDVCRDAAWDRYAAGVLNSGAAYHACFTVRCGG
jgi:hypothetical protein